MGHLSQVAIESNGWIRDSLRNRLYMDINMKLKKYLDVKHRITHKRPSQKRIMNTTVLRKEKRNEKKRNN